MLISLEGLPGAGKTTSAALLGKRAGWEYAEEQSALNPFLPAFYRDVDRYGLETEFAFLLLHAHQWKDLDPLANVVLDFAPGKDLVFARMNLSGEDLDLFERLYKRLYHDLPKPDLTVFLDLSPNLALERMRWRGRDYEKDVPLDYVVQLKTAYEAEMIELGRHVLRVSVDRDQTPDEVATHLVDRISSVEIE